MVEDVEELLERLHDEDEGDEGGEALLSESGDVTDQGGEVKRHHDEQDGTDPQPDPEPKWQVVQPIVSGNMMEWD